jgi:hypothetical protein
MSVREDQSEGFFHGCSFRVLVEVGENILAEILSSAEFMNNEQPVFSSSSLQEWDATPGRISAIDSTRSFE